MICWKHLNRWRDPSCSCVNTSSNFVYRAEFFKRMVEAAATGGYMSAGAPDYATKVLREIESRVEAGTLWGDQKP